MKLGSVLPLYPDNDLKATDTYTLNTQYSVGDWLDTCCLSVKSLCIPDALIYIKIVSAASYYTSLSQLIDCIE